MSGTKFNTQDKISMFTFLNIQDFIYIYTGLHGGWRRGGRELLSIVLYYALYYCYIYRSATYCTEKGKYLKMRNGILATIT